ncbi:MAG: hypothetical protein JSS42_01195 [Proteobacteria bacterium]|uniref:hypothetical protein n=1 Tax=Rudaea sp. TaxID=2136325 RepID=UPI0032204E8F|nr:hypothetical protein [Pseudomonadota bacterium]
MPYSVSRKSKFALALAALAVSTLTHPQQPTFSSLEERMSYKEFREYGLDKLSPEQLKGLNTWLQSHGTQGTAGVAALPAAGAAPDPVAQARIDQQKIVSRLKGEFTGWHQGTVLTLENGQRWEVLNDDTVYAHGVQSPEVTIEKGGLIGGWRLTVAGQNDIAHVMPLAR